MSITIEKDKAGYDIWLYHKEIEDDEIVQRPGVTWWLMGQCVSIKVSTDEEADKLFEALKNVIDVDVD